MTTVWILALDCTFLKCRATDKILKWNLRYKYDDIRQIGWKVLRAFCAYFAIVCSVHPWLSYQQRNGHRLWKIACLPRMKCFQNMFAKCCVHCTILKLVQSLLHFDFFWMITGQLSIAWSSLQNMLCYVSNATIKHLKSKLNILI